MRKYKPISKRRDNLEGIIFGRLTAQYLLGSYQNKHYWLCKCSCGCLSEVPAISLRSGNTTSCGCLTRENSIAKSKTHGMSHTPIYGMWRRMIQRCEDPNCTDYSYYGGRGISVCPEWHDFANFIRDVGERPDGMTLERIRNNEGYSHGNVRWASRHEQMQNTRGVVLITHNGETRTISEWARYVGIKPSTLNARLNVLGYTIEEALLKEVKFGAMLNGKTWKQQEDHNAANT